MKIYGAIVLAIAIVFSYMAYTTNRAETLTYEFCSQFSPGNQLTLFYQLAEEQGYEKLETDSENIEEFKLTNSTFSLQTYACQISFEQGKITELAVVKL
ncbi:hypothetical protein [Pleionea sediminis]|uniref:hypothetical protein n=1 Tax=Pleionea sediminis TaxID=2569479 RepID=UPI0011850C80|nr:hypothetical protein [Pleionea sediminis]